MPGPDAVPGNAGDGRGAPAEHRRAHGPLLVGALGVVYGDIGTSPLYAFRESLRAAGEAGRPPGEADVLGILSLVVWALVVVVALKYVLFVMRADNQGEGGIMALLALARPRVRGPRARLAVLAVGVAGAALLYGDGMITPAISVLSAVEGLSVATPVFEPVVVPLAVVVLVALFAVQRYGSGRIGGLFGAVMLAWFAALAATGVPHLLAAPRVLAALDPLRGLAFLATKGATGFAVLGSVFLVVTGAEALYADMGHFARGAIRLDWFALVLPALVLNYLGQGALVLAQPEAAENPFFLMVPGALLYPVVALATAATVIASQALISGAFTLSQQATLLGLLPRLEIRQTSSAEPGQIYVPQVNGILMVAVVALVLGFRSSDALAQAYGIAVVSTMLATTVLAGIVARRLWGWGRPATGLVVGGFLLVDLAFLAANAPKVPRGGWFPLVVGAGVFTLMMTWRRGRRIVLERLDDAAPLRPFLDALDARPGADAGPVLDGAAVARRVPGTAVYFSARRDAVPSALALNLRHNKVLHERVLILNVEIVRAPFLREGARVEARPLPAGFWSVVVRFGFFERPDVPAALEAATRGPDPALPSPLDPEETSFFLGREVPVPTVRPELAGWQAAIYAFLARNAVSAPEYYLVPTERVVELGTRIEL